jgi:hypothetical protein
VPQRRTAYAVHQITNQSISDTPAHVSMPGVHRVASLVKRWVLGTHQGGLARQHLDSYLDEFSFRFNRRASRNRGLVFYRLLQQCLQTRPLGYEDIVFSRRPERGAVRGPAPTPRRRAAKPLTDRRQTRDERTVAPAVRGGERPVEAASCGGRATAHTSG